MSLEQYKNKINEARFETAFGKRSFVSETVRMLLGKTSLAVEWRTLWRTHGGQHYKGLMIRKACSKCSCPICSV